MSEPAPLTFSPEPERVLLILPTWVGDVVMATPFIKVVHERFADADVVLVLHRHLVPVLEGSPWLERYFCWPPRDSSSAAKAARKKFVQALRNERFDLAVTLPNSFRSAWLTVRCRAKRRVGFNRDGRGLLLTDRLEVPNKVPGTLLGKPRFEPMPLVDYYAHLAAALGCMPPGDGLELFTTAADDRVVDQALVGHRSEQPLVVICPGANFGASKCWLPERFAAVADELVASHNAFVAISPGPGEEPLAQAIADAMQSPSLLLQDPCISLGELKSLIRRSHLLIGNDTGPRHFARAFGVHRVTVFGPTEERWTDTSHGQETIVRVDVPCGPCHQKVCPLERRVCMENVTVAMVTAACRTELDSALSRQPIELQPE